MSLVSAIKKRLGADLDLRELLTGSSRAFIFRLAGFALGYLFMIAVIRTDGPDAWGVFALAFTVMQISVLIARMGIDIAVLRFAASFAARDEYGQIRRLYRNALIAIGGMSLLATGGLYLVSDLLAEGLFHKPQLGPAFQWIAFAIIPTAFLTLNYQALRGLKRIGLYSFLMNVPAYALAAILFFVLLWTDGGSLLPVKAFVFASYGAALVSVIAWMKYRPAIEEGMPEHSDATTKTLWRVGTPLFLASSLFFLLQWTDTLMIGVFLDERDVGIYNATWRLGMAVAIAVRAINAITGPKFAELWARGAKDKLETFAQQAALLGMGVAMPIMLILVLFPKSILRIFGEGMDAGSTVLILLVAGQFFKLACGSVDMMMQMTSKERAYRNIILVATALNIGLNYVLIPKLGINGAAIASVICTVVWNFSSAMYVRKTEKFWCGVNPRLLISLFNRKAKTTHT